MKSYNYLIIFTLFALTLTGFVKDDKNPVAENDFVTVKVRQTFEILVLKNDYAFDSHPFKISYAVGGSLGGFLKTDSSIIYTSDIAIGTHTATDSIVYNIVDLENGLASDFAKVYIEIINDGFELLNVNQVSCRINAYELQFWSMDPDVLLNYEVPSGSGVSSVFSQSTWIGGLEATGRLCMAAERYRIQGTDFFSGPVMDSLAYCNEQDVKWHKVWKLNQDEIFYHNQHWKDIGYEPIENILKWPGNGDTSLGQAKRLAPFNDRDGDGNYNPMHGDSPVIKGDQAILVLNNDDRDAHTESGGRKLGIEIQTLYYAYEAELDSALKYTTFADQCIINRSSTPYHDVYVGHFVDFDLGSFLDDFLHCDTSLESAICYNGDAVDGQGNAGEYGEHPPAQSFSCLNYEMGGFTYFLNWGVPSQMQDPQIDWEYYNYLRGFWRDSTSFTYGGNGYGGEVPVKFIFTGDPVSDSGWTESGSPLGPGDRRGVISSGPYILEPGDTIHLTFAYVFAWDRAGTNLSNVALLKDRIMQVREFYQNSLGNKEMDISQAGIELYPNPCMTSLCIDIESLVDIQPTHYSMYDGTGKLVKQGAIKNKGKSIVKVGDISPGLYILKLTDGQVSLTGKFIKE